MDFAWDRELQEFQREVQEFVRRHRTPELLAEMQSGEEGRDGPRIQAFRKELADRGWLRMCWPKAYGGEAKSPWYQYLLIEELEYWGMPYGSLTVTSVAPAIMAFGTEEQKQEYLPGIWNGELTFAIGYSEPNAGTDLASMETRAVRDGDEWVINGQKIYTSMAHVATHVWLAARTDPDAPKHRGISMFIVPMDTPGVSVRPLWTMAGMRTNETFYEDVRVPAKNLVGEENRGWYTIMHALDHERVGLAPVGGILRSYDLLLEHLRESRPDLLSSPRVRMRLAELRLDIQIDRALAVKNAWIIANGQTPIMEASMVKVWSSELRYRLHSLAMDLLGRYGGLRRESGEAAPAGGRMEQTYRSSPILRFGGGTNEVQRDIIAIRGLGLPR